MASYAGVAQAGQVATGETGTKKSVSANIKDKISGISVCPTCEQGVDDSYKESIIKREDKICEKIITDLKKTENELIDDELKEYAYRSYTRPDFFKRVQNPAHTVFEDNGMRLDGKFFSYANFSEPFVDKMEVPFYKDAKEEFMASITYS